MKEGPNIARVAALIGDPARANILSALMSGKALTATELAAEAGVAASTASAHLGKLEEGGLIVQSKQGRHRYFTLSSGDIAAVLEALMGLAQRTGATRVRTGPKDPHLRRARVCYDHLAGEMGVQMYESMLAKNLICGDDEDLALTPRGRDFCQSLGCEARWFETRRKACRPCLDWSMRRNHLAGSIGAALWHQIQTLGWASRDPTSRSVRFTRAGEAAFLSAFG